MIFEFNFYVDKLSQGRKSSREFAWSRRNGRQKTSYGPKSDRKVDIWHQSHRKLPEIGRWSKIRLKVQIYCVSQQSFALSKTLKISISNSKSLHEFVSFLMSKRRRFTQQNPFRKTMWPLKISWMFIGPSHNTQQEFCILNQFVQLDIA